MSCFPVAIIICVLCCSGSYHADTMGFVFQLAFKAGGIVDG